MRRHAYRAVAAISALWPASAHAHGFGQRYDLPLPLSYYLVGSGLVVGLSFVLLIASARSTPAEARSARWHLTLPLGGIPAALRSLILIAFRAFGLGVLLLVIVAGLFGDQSPIRNIAPSTVWVLTWVALAFVCSLVTNAWIVLNPWHTLFDWGGRGLALIGLARPDEPRSAYPEWLGTWPAVLFFWCFAWSELAWSGGESPANLAWLALGYSVITLAGMARYGPIWLERAEFFSMFFGLMGRFAPVRVDMTGLPSAESDRSVPNADGTIRPSLLIRPFGSGLVPASAASASFSAFILLMLSTVTFDGLMETPAWAATVDATLTIEPLAPILFGLRDLFGDVRDGLETIALVVFPAIAFAIFYGVNALMRRVSLSRSTSGGPVSTMALVGWFALSLLPIAIGYHFAHYLSFLLIAGQLSISLISDPLGFGWDLFGTAHYRIDIGVINARTTWYVAIVSIVLGHLIAVILAHVTALRVFADRKSAAVSELPMIALMIGYTSLSLWILAQPIVE